VKVLVTGAAGNLGSRTCRALTREGIDVVATDRHGRDDLPVRVHVADLLERRAIEALANGIDAVVHLGNHICFEPPDAPKIFGENVQMNVNVFEAAIAGGAKKLIFASSIQVIGSVPRLPKPNPADAPAYLPVDGESPPFPTNPYALSKQVGEVMLQYYTRVYGVESIAVRWPGMGPRGAAWGGDGPWEQNSPQLRPQAFAGVLSFEDAAELVLAILRTSLPGYRVYLPAPKRNMLGRPAAEVIERYLPNVPLRKPIDQIDNLVDLSRIQSETGWSPSD
jgi:nucleoside-diphosphate-sugar epimerase